MFVWYIFLALAWCRPFTDLLDVVPIKYLDLLGVSMGWLSGLLDLLQK